MNGTDNDQPLTNATAGSVPHLDSCFLRHSSANVNCQSQCISSKGDENCLLPFKRLEIFGTVSRSGIDFEHAMQDINDQCSRSGTSGNSDNNSTQVVRQLVQHNDSFVSFRKCRECPLCFIRQPLMNFPRISCCNHRSCKSCLVQYLQVEIMESRVQLTCPECSELLHPTDIYSLMEHCPELIEKYETFALRRVLMMDPDARWCPAPDCTYAVIATSCAACPELRCERPGCGALFCYHCKGPWHASQTCDEARKARGEIYRRAAPQLMNSQDNILKRGDIKACPRCRTYIVKMNDGSCNHMVCAMCNVQFCWLPTGCTFWGKKPWTRKKKLLCQIGTLIGAPVGIALIAGLAIPGIIFGVPVFVGRKVNQRFAHLTKIRRRCLTVGSVVGSLVVSPVLAVMAVGVGVPIMLAYVYGVVPLSLCRNGGCGVSSSSSKLEQDNLDDYEIWHEVNNRSREKSPLLNDIERQDGTSVVTRMSLNSGLSGVQAVHNRLQVQAELCRRRPSIESGITSLGEKCNYEEASTKAMAGSQYNDDKSVQTLCSGQEAISYCEEVASIVALAGSVVDAKSLTDSASGRVFVTQMYCRERDLSPSSQHAISCDDPTKSGDERSCENQQQHRQEVAALMREDTVSYEDTSKRRGRAVSSVSAANVGVTLLQVSHGSCTNSRYGIVAANVASNLFHAVWSTHSSDSSNAKADRFHIRALFDTMKRIVSDDVAAEPSRDYHRPVLRRSAQEDISPNSNG
ncbi:unnamed protein product [Thelazia callipaeda]|uniref:RBR-type E3 ubiquitin transferase n=1 Tax=Thelazia callipaeda TaxID=103827 RepID=A0A0N5D5F0_THECL|nr:unnamed protein product [Thelazia callipaeda]